MDEQHDHLKRPVAQHWAPSVLFMVLAAITIAPLRLNAVTLAVAGVLVVLAWVLSPWFFPHSQAEQAAREAARKRNVPLIYWRPGCSYCLRLRIVLGVGGNRAVWVDVSRSDPASASVRGVNGGDETVPTVFMGSEAQVNPSPRWVRDRLNA